MYLVVIGWLYVVLMMAVVEASSPSGSVLGGISTFALYGLLPLSIIVYVMRSPDRRAKRKAQEALELTQANGSQPSAAPDAGGHAPGAAQDSGVAPVREKL